MSERINFNDLGNNPEYKDYRTNETARTNGLHINIRRLMELTEREPVIQIPLAELEDQLNHPCWTDVENKSVSPRHIINKILTEGFDDAKDNYPEIRGHIEKIEESDRSYPVHMYEGNIINGMHRLSQVFLNKELGLSSQDFLTVKELVEIPPEALMQSSEKDDEL